MDYAYLNAGQLAPPELEQFISFKAVKSFPARFIPATQQAQVVVEFWANGKISARDWDLFYIYPPAESLSSTPILMVPSSQFESLLDDIRKKLKIRVNVPKNGAKFGFLSTFSSEGPRPRYLGHSSSPETMEKMKLNVPAADFKLVGELDPTISSRSLEAFKSQIELMSQSDKQKKQLAKERKRAERFEKQKSWGRQNKRIQRYLGLRPMTDGFWKTPGPTNFRLDLEKPAPYPQDGSVVFVCIDVEAWEMNNKVVTEVGVATLDTKDIIAMAPGEGGENWMNAIRVRHFRISENAQYVNGKHVSGCPDKFQFGESEFVSLKEIASTIASCFRFPPVTADSGDPAKDEASGELRERSIILLGHDVGGDVSWLKSLGYDPTNLANLHEVADTDTMYRAFRRETTSRSLGAVLSDLDILGWHLHNAGNDAAYTLQAMIRIAILDLEERVSPPSREATIQKRIEELVLPNIMKIQADNYRAMKNAAEHVKEMQLGWSSDGDDSDGGLPVSSTRPRYSERSPTPVVAAPAATLRPGSSTTTWPSLQNSASSSNFPRRHITSGQSTSPPQQFYNQHSYHRAQSSSSSSMYPQQAQPPRPSPSHVSSSHSRYNQRNQRPDSQAEQPSKPWQRGTGRRTPNRRKENQGHRVNEQNSWSSK